MAKRGSVKRLSVEQEEHIAHLYRGRRSKSSGASDTDQGDVRCKHILIECKMSKGKVPAWVKEFVKITKEAYSEGREPVMAFRFYEPGHPLADRDGWIDLTVRRTADDAERERKYETQTR